jgi:hypothetical protein
MLVKNLETFFFVCVCVCVCVQLIPNGCGMTLYA